MKKILLILLVVIFTFSSCETFSDYGYPGKVTFSKDGGEKYVHGDRNFGCVEIVNPNSGECLATVSSYEEWEKDTIEISYDWLTVKYASNDCTYFIIDTKPNDTGKKRKLGIDFMVADFRGDITVEQKAK